MIDWNEKYRHIMELLDEYKGEPLYEEQIPELAEYIFDKHHLASELGDVAWYLAVSAYCLGFSLEDVFRINIQKLRNRYPEGFDTEHSIHRKVGDV